MKKKYTADTTDYKYIARYFITSRKLAEQFITEWTQRHKRTRKEALEYLHAWGIYPTRMKKK